MSMHPHTHTLIHTHTRKLHAQSPLLSRAHSQILSVTGIIKRSLQHLVSKRFSHVFNPSGFYYFSGLLHTFFELEQPLLPSLRSQPSARWCNPSLLTDRDGRGEEQWDEDSRAGAEQAHVLLIVSNRGLYGCIHY